MKKKIAPMKLRIWFWWFNLICDLKDVRRRIWNKGILLWWYRLWIRKDEFHKSLNPDFSAMLVMDKEELKEYHLDIVRRRNIAHYRDNERQDQAHPRTNKKEP
jgi:hypothetical protein